MPVPRLFVTGPLAPERPLDLAAGQAHYLRNVLRLGRGDRVLAFNGRDGEWMASLDAIAKGGATIVPVKRTAEQWTGPDLWLCFAPVKRSRIDLIAEKATELGVARLQPVMTRFTDMSRVNIERLTAIAVEASEQCGRLDVPVLAEPVTLSRLIGDWPQARPIVVCAERGDADAMADVARRIGSGPVAVLVGPEGGFAAEELDALAELDFAHCVGLGPRILRAETAAVAALACWQCLAGDWSGRPPARTF